MTAGLVTPPGTPRAGAGSAAARVAGVLQLAIDRLTGGDGRDAIASREGGGGAAGAAGERYDEGDSGAPGDASPAHGARDGDRLGTVTLLPHQREGARRLQRALAAHGGALLADEVGTGKTFTALAVARGYPGVRIVAPAALRAAWDDACRRAQVPQWEFISYERLSAGYLPPAPSPPLLLLDEAHHARTPGTRRYRTLAALARGTHVLLLSATPVHNRRRDLEALLALFLGTGALLLDNAELATLVVRRSGMETGHPLPALRNGVRHELPAAPELLDLLRSLPPPVPPSDGDVAQALVTLQLTRAWCSSDAALLAAIRRRLVTAAALEEALREGRHPARHDLALWSGDEEGSVQLAFPALCAPPLPAGERAGTLLAAVEAHAAALRRLRAAVRGAGARDGARFVALSRILAAPGATPALVFTHSAETAGAAFAALRDQRATALLTGRGAWIASGPLSKGEVLAAFAPGGSGRPGTAAGAPLDVLVATDVVSEGVDLQRAATIVHLDLPWTAARLEQRIGRVRRVGSRHATVTVHYIAPPAGAAELASTLRLLAQKERLATHAVGPSSTLGDAQPWRASATSATSAGGASDAYSVEGAGAPSPAQARQLLIGRLRALLQLARREGGTPFAPVDAAGDQARGRRPRSPSRTGTPVATPAWLATAYWHLPSAAQPMAVALLEIGGEWQVLVGTTHSLTIEPRQVLRLVEQLLALARDKLPETPAVSHAPAGTPTDLVAPDSARTMVEAVEQWCARQRADGQLALPVAQRSPAHRRILLALDAVPATIPRAARAGAAARAAHARALVLAQRGAGAEDVLLELAASAPSPLQGIAAAERWLGDVLRALGTGTPPSPSAPSIADDGPAERRNDRPSTSRVGGRGVHLVSLLVAGPDPPR